MRSEFFLPYPPSVNGLYANRKGGRRKTKNYAAWIREAGWMVQTQADRHNRHHGAIRLTLLVRKPDNRRRDLGNLEKSVSDLLVRHNIILDDCQIVDSRSKWETDPAISLGFHAKVIIEDV